MLTSRTRYGLKALVHLALRREEGPVNAAQIAEAEDIPPKFLEAILVELRNKGLIHSKAGRGGGHQLAREPRDISVLEVLRAIEGPVAPLPCLSRTAYHRCDDCPDEDACGTRRVMGLVYDATLGQLERTTLADAIRESRRPVARTRKHP